MNKDEIKLDFIIVQKIINQLINSDGMEVSNRYLIQQNIYYIDNVELIETLEKIILDHFYQYIQKKNGNVTSAELLQYYNPSYINYDKYYNELKRKYSKQQADDNLNKYLGDG